MYVCICHSVSDRQIHQAVEEGARSMADLARQHKVGTCCGRCVNSARQTLNEALAVRVEFAESELALAV